MHYACLYHRLTSASARCPFRPSTSAISFRDSSTLPTHTHQAAPQLPAQFILTLLAQCLSFSQLLAHHFADLLDSSGLVAT